ncbi:MAG: helix-turn-helix transcriptional regulator [Carnobacterium sp.]
MTVFERIKQLADKRGVSVSKVATDLGFSENLFYQWKTASPKSDRLEKVADYFGVSVDYLLGREQSSENEIPDLADNSAIFAFDGKPVSDEERAFLQSVIESYRKNKK